MTAAEERSSPEHEQKPDDHSAGSLSADEERALPSADSERHHSPNDENDAREPSLAEKPAAPPSPGPGPGPPPNGGTQAWLQVLGGFMLFFNTWGILK